jgi:hypothetical protein
MTDERQHRPVDGDGPPRDVVRALRPDAADTVGGRDIAPQVVESLKILGDACGTNLAAAIFFGSVLVGTSPSKDSAADIFVVVEDYERFYRDIGTRLPQARRASIMAALNRALPPNVIYLKDPGALRAGAKCFVISRKDLSLGLSRDAKDHFCRGRLVQRIQIVYSRDPEVREEIEAGLESARRVSLEWVPIYLPEKFSVLDFCLRMLEVSYAGEIRPESPARVKEVFNAQRSYFRLMFGRLLSEAAADGYLEFEDHMYSRSSPPSFRERFEWRLFFVQSKVRATLRWFKYMLTFDDWLDYIARKAERRTGVRVELTKAERRFPIILLWPKLFRVLKAMGSKTPAQKNGVHDAGHTKGKKE